MNGKMIESDFMSLGKSDLIKCIGPAVLGVLFTALYPAVTTTIAALNAGVFPAIPGNLLASLQPILLKALGAGIETGGLFLMHKFLSDSNGSPLGGIFNKYFTPDIPVAATGQMDAAVSKALAALSTSAEVSNIKSAIAQTRADAIHAPIGGQPFTGNPTKGQ